MDKYYEKEYLESVFSLFNIKNDCARKLSTFYMYNCFEQNHIDIRQKKILDFGCGLGHITFSVQADCYDISEFCRNKIKESSNQLVFDSEDQIPKNNYDIILYNHSLEHYLIPTNQLSLFKTLLKPDGTLAIVLSIDKATPFVAYKQDIHRHFYNWNFQNISNLLIELGNKVSIQKFVYGSTRLTKFNNLELIRKLGKFRKIFPSQLTLATI